MYGIMETGILLNGSIPSLGRAFFLRNGTAAQNGMDECGRKDPEEEDNELFGKHLRNHDSVNEPDQDAQNMQMTVSVISSGL